MVVKSKFPDVEIPDITIHDLVFGDLGERADKLAMIDGVTGEGFTYRELKRLSQTVSSGLVKLGVRKGDVVMIVSPNNPYYCIVLYGIMRVGAIVTTVNPHYTTYELEHQIKDSGATYIYTVGDLISKVKQAAQKVDRVKEIICHGQIEGCVSLSQLLYDDGNAEPKDMKHDTHNDTALILYSSGTTGLPKGVMITHRNIVADIVIRSNIRLMQSYMYSKMAAKGEQVVLLGYLPYFHMFGLFNNLIHGLYKGAKIITLPKVVPEQFCSTIEKYRVKILSVVPPIVIMLVKNPIVRKYDLSSIEVVGSGAAPLDAETEAALRKLLPNTRMRQGYGMTEALTLVLALAEGNQEGSSGVLMSNTDLKLVDLKTGEEVGEGERGEIWIRGPQVMKGYLNKPEATANTIDKDGWLHTGDVAYYDKTGHFFIVARIKELIKVKGFQVAPAELEALLLTHPAVEDVGVIGVPDEHSGELPRAYVVKKTNYTTVTADELQGFIQDKLVHYKWLAGGVRFIDAIPKTASGKIIRQKLKDMVESEIKSKL